MMGPLAFVLLKTRWGRQRAYRLLKDGYQRKRLRYDNDSAHVLPSTRAKRARELEQIAAAIAELERRDRDDA